MTRQESYAMATILSLLLLGTLVKHIQKNTFLFDHNIYQETDSLFAAATQAMNKKQNKQDTLHYDTLQHPNNQQPNEDSTLSIEHVLFANGKININTATQQELETLPRIGPAIAKRIITHRNTAGPFKHIEHITTVKGIGPKTLETLKPHITTTNPATQPETRNKKQETNRKNPKDSPD